jgi:hypothetical protein
MDLQIIEHHPKTVLEALRRGEFDGLEIVGEADEKEFFERLFREKLLEALAATMPTICKKEEVPQWFILSANLSLKLHQENSFLAFERVIRCGGLLSALPPELASKRLDPETQALLLHCQGFNHKNDYERTTPCHQDTLRKALKRVPAPQWLDWYTLPTPPPPQRPEHRIRREAKRQCTLAQRKAQAPVSAPERTLAAVHVCAIQDFNSWSSATVPLHVALFREAYSDGSEDAWGLLTTGELGDGWPLRQDYHRRTDIEERHRQFKCFYDLTDFRSRSFNAIAAQVVMILLSYTLRQWQLWQMLQEQLADHTPDTMRFRLAMRREYIIIYHQHAYTQMPQVRFTRELLQLDDEARRKALSKVQHLEQSMLEPVDLWRPP